VRNIQNEVDREDKEELGTDLDVKTSEDRKRSGEIPGSATAGTQHASRPAGVAS